MDRFWSVFAIVLMCVVAQPALAELKERPKGEDIANKAKKATLEKDRAATGTHEKKKCTFIPADLSHIKTEKELENGHFIGQMNTELPGDLTKLPPGKYNLYLAKVKGEWHVYAESGGKIVEQAHKVKFEKKVREGKPDNKKLEKPTFHKDDTDYYWHGCWWIFCLTISW